LQQLSLQYPDELHIIQVDNAPGHLLSTSELPENIILLFPPPHCPEVNPTERVGEYIKEFLACLVFSNLDELRVKLQKILSSLTNHVIGFLTGWSGILHSLSLSHLLKNGIKRIIQGDVGRLVLTHKDRLLRLGAELVLAMCAEFETEVIIINKSKESVTFEQELVPDMSELITVFSAGLYGRAPSEKSETD
jgi:hypothetical protein